MIRALWTAASGMVSQQLNVDTIANNLANVNTSGFKKARAEFQDLIYARLRPPAGPEGAYLGGIEVGHGVRPSATQRCFTQGNLQQTGNPLDLAIEGLGFFPIEMPDGTTAYTRDGSFKLDAEGNIVTSDGYLLDWDGDQIPEDTQEILIAPDGTVSVIGSGQDQPDELGQIELVRFVNPAGLESLGKNLFRATPSAGEESRDAPGTEGLGTILQCYLETSNVQVVEEMVSLITAQRAYEINSKAIQASDEMLQVANNLRR